MPKADLSSMPFPALETWVTETLGLPKFRAGQIFSWLHRRHAASFDEMSDLPAALRLRLGQEAFITRLSVHTEQRSALDGTRKFLLSLADGNRVEAVRMEYHHGPSFCISTQVGCRMGCAFCASTIGGLVRNLTAGEMLGEIQELASLTGEPDSIVLMGIGEPLDNYQNLLNFLDILSDPRGCGMSLRRVSLSTCGLADRIDDLADKKLGLTLSVSLHAADDETRSRIMPVNREYDIERLMTACRRYFSLTGRRISYEYALIDGVNDTPVHARRLAGLLRGQPCHVNLIPVNPVAGRGTRRSRPENTERFAALLGKLGVNATVRRELGRDIDAACGQLRRSRQEQEN